LKEQDRSNSIDERNISISVKSHGSNDLYITWTYGKKIIEKDFDKSDLKDDLKNAGFEDQMQMISQTV